jgi:hypothetical protein
VADGLRHAPHVAKRRKRRAGGECDATREQTKQAEQAEQAGGAPRHGGDPGGPAMILPCKSLYFPRADAALARVESPDFALRAPSGLRSGTSGGRPAAWRPIREGAMILPCKFLFFPRPDAQFHPTPVAAASRQPRDPTSPGEGKGRLGLCLNLNQLPRSCPAPPAARRKSHCAATTYPALWIGTRLANPVASRA